MAEDKEVVIRRWKPWKEGDVQTFHGEFLSSITNESFVPEDGDWHVNVKEGCVFYFVYSGETNYNGHPINGKHEDQRKGRVYLEPDRVHLSLWAAGRARIKTRTVCRCVPKADFTKLKTSMKRGAYPVKGMKLK